MARHIERPFVALVASTTICVTVCQTTALMARSWIRPSEASAASEISWLMVIIGLSFACAQVFVGSRKTLRWIGFTLSAAGLIYLVLHQGFLSIAAVTCFVFAFTETQVAQVITGRLPPSLDGMLRVRPAASLPWAFVGVILLIQTGRLSAFMADDNVDWWLTSRQPLWAKHMCLPGYIEPVDLHLQGVDNVYDTRYYSAIDRSAAPHLTVRNMDAYVGDPFQYPPQFLLGPYLALLISRDFSVLRSLWFTVLVAGFVVVAYLLARWLQPETGWGPLLLLPLVWISVPAMQSFQFGQFHIAAIALAIAAMLAFERERQALGGLLLAVAILGKIFPGVLLLFLALRRQWKSVGWTVGFIGLATLAALLVLGEKPFEAFLTYHLPRLLSGEAFTFELAWPELRDFFIADNLSPGGIVSKLHELGVPGMTGGVAAIILRVYALLILALIFIAAKRGDGRLQLACTWLALLNLGALQSPGAWGDYVTLGTVWLLSLLSWREYRGKVRVIFLFACWIFSFTVVGNQPMPELLPVPLMMILTTISALLMLAVNAWAIFSVRRVQSGVAEPGEELKNLVHA